MQSFNVIRASAFRGLRPWLFDKVIPLELVAGLKEQYHFVKPDNVVPSLDFHAGRFIKDERIIKIEQFVVAQVGNQATSLGASTRESSDASDDFLNDLLAWASREYAPLDTKEVYARAYLSQVEFTLDESLSEHFREFREVGEAIANYVKGYGLQECPPYKFTSLHMNFDVAEFSTLTPMPQPFAIEPRQGIKHEERKYFSQAPLRTQDHRAILEQIERILLR